MRDKAKVSEPSWQGESTVRPIAAASFGGKAMWEVDGMGTPELGGMFVRMVGAGSVAQANPWVTTLSNIRHGM